MVKVFINGSARRTTYEQIDFQRLNFRTCAFFEDNKQANHKTSRFGYDEVFGLVEGCKRRIGVGGKDDVVEPRDGHLRRGQYSCWLQVMHYADCLHIIVTDHCGGADREIKEILQSGLSGNILRRSASLLTA